MVTSQSSLSLDETEKEKGLGLVDAQAAAEDPTEYEPIRTEPGEKATESHGDGHGPRGSLSRLQSSTSAYSEASTTESNATTSTQTKKPFYKRLNVLKNNPPPVPRERTVSPEYTAGVLSKLTWQWMQPIMRVGYKRPLEKNDIWKVNPDRSADVLTARLEAAFNRRREQGGEKPLLGAMFDTFKWEFIVGGLCQLSASVIQAIAPFVLRYLISFAVKAYVAQRRGVPGPPIGEGIGLVIAITVMQFLQSLATNHFMYRGMMIGGEARGVLIALIFNKAMKLSGRAKAGGQAALEAPPPDLKPGSEAELTWYKKILKKKKEEKKQGPRTQAGVAGDGEGWGNGRIVNLMSTDTYRIDQASGFFHMIWTAPIGILITTALLLVNLSYSALPGLGLILIAMPLLGRAVKTLFRRRVVINKMTDQRVSLTQEILQGVRFVKYFGWETSFLERIQAIRKKEIYGIQVLLTIRNAVLSVGMAMPVFASMLSFITYSQFNSNLDPAPIFSSLALFNSMRIPLNFLPLVIGQVIDANASVKRIQEFLLAEEAEESGRWDYEAKDAVVLRDADFTWERHPTQEAEEGPGKGGGPGRKGETKKEKKAAAEAMRASGATTPSDATAVEEEEKPFELKGLNLTFGRSELVAIIGGVGSGKTSLLAALAGDMRKTNGEVIFGASRAFCPQYAWIQNATVRENIIFGKEFKGKWYEQVVNACALRPDLDMLPHNDATEIGERGITVSGGQKQRMNIARAIYFDADIILMDDPLSAVDAHVGRHIMDNAICGLLKDKCRILATHQLHVLSRCDRIIWVDQGRVKAVDTFDNLMAQNADFIQVMSTTAKEEEEKEEEEEGGGEEGEGEEEEKGETAAKVKSVKKPNKSRKQAALMQQEERATKSVSWQVWIEYIKAGGGMWVGPLVFVLLVLSQGANIVTSLWLSYWTSDKFGYSQDAYIGAYAAFGFSQALFAFFFSFAVSIFGTRAGKVMLHRAITRVLRAPMSFFDTTPLGRITNRFSKDIDVMDNTLTDSIRMYFMTLAMIISVFILIISYYYYYAIALGPLFLLFMFSAGFYRSSAREVKRHEAVLRSTVFSRFGEAVMGTPTIRAYGLQEQFSKSVRDAVDDMNSAYYLTFANQRWLSVRLDVVGIALVFTTGILVVTSRFSVDPSIAGLVLSYILTIVQMIQFTVRQLAEVENNMNSTERIHHYGRQLEEEAALHMGQVRPTWPEHGEIVFDKVEMRYRSGLPLVLKGLSMHVHAGERIGVVGRTGAGKSSIMSALFRLQELCGGSIVVDGVDIAKIGLHDLRSKLAIIPQDPTLFKGTIRSNLDPFHEHSDLELWSALRQADLVSTEQAMDDHSGRIHLDSVVEEEGLNFSLGQRQLMALARALVRNSQIIVCDEATSSVDFETDAKIQQTIMEGFKGKTLLCIAHRLKTIIHYDRICVMDAGQIAELDSPLRLYDEGGIFKGMCERSGIKREEIAGAGAGAGAGAR